MTSRLLRNSIHTCVSNTCDSCMWRCTFLWFWEQTAIRCWLKLNMCGRVMWAEWLCDTLRHYVTGSNCGGESCRHHGHLKFFLKTLAVLKSMLLQSCINQAPDSPDCFAVGQEMGHMWMSCCLVVDWDIRDCLSCSAQGFNLSLLLGTRDAPGLTI